MANKKETKKEEKRDISSEINIDEIKKEIVEYAQNSVTTKIDELVKKADRRLISQKNRTIFWKNILIIIFICLSGFLTYLLYNEGYFNQFFNQKVEENPVVVEEQPRVTEEETEENELEKLKKEYAYLVNEINLSENSNYLEDFYEGKLTNKLKLSITIANLDKDNIVKDDDVYSIDAKVIEEEYSKLFSNNDFKNSSITLNDTSIKYLKSANVYIFDEMFSNDLNIKKEIISISKKDDNITITTIEGLAKDNKLYNVISKELVSDDNLSLQKNSKKLNKITYKFEKANDKYILNSITK